MARKKIVPRNDKNITLLSYFKCMKNINTRLPLMDAISKAIQTLSQPRSMTEMPTVIPVKASRAARTTNRNL